MKARFIDFFKPNRWRVGFSLLFFGILVSIVGFDFDLLYIIMAILSVFSIYIICCILINNSPRIAIIKYFVPIGIGFFGILSIYWEYERYISYRNTYYLDSIIYGCIFILSCIGLLLVQILKPKSAEINYRMSFIKGIAVILLLLVSLFVIWQLLFALVYPTLKLPDCPDGFMEYNDYAGGVDGPPEYLYCCFDNNSNGQCDWVDQGVSYHNFMTEKECGANYKSDYTTAMSDCQTACDEARQNGCSDSALQSFCNKKTKSIYNCPLKDTEGNILLGNPGQCETQLYCNQLIDCSCPEKIDMDTCYEVKCRRAYDIKAIHGTDSEARDHANEGIVRYFSIGSCNLDDRIMSWYKPEYANCDAALTS